MMERFPAHNQSFPASPQLFNTRVVLALSVFLLVIAIFLEVLQSLQPTNLILNAQKQYEWFLPFSMIAFIFLVIRIYAQLRRLQYLEHCRMAVAQKGDQKPESIDMFLGGTLSAPTATILLVIKKMFVWSICSIILLLLLLVIIPNLLSLIALGDLTLFLGISAFIGALALFALVCTFISFQKMSLIIEITERGIKVGRKGDFIPHETHMDWHEAGLFVCYQLPSLLLGRRTVVYYELCSSTQVVTWMWVRDPQSPFTIWKPLLSAEEYHGQMRALCDLVSVKTGLPLYELDHHQEGKG